MSDFNYQQWRTASAVTPAMLDSCLDRIAELEGQRDAYADRAAAVYSERKLRIEAEATIEAKERIIATLVSERRANRKLRRANRKLLEQAEAERGKFSDVLHKTNAEWQVDIKRANTAEAALAQDRLEADAYAQTAETELQRLRDDLSLIEADPLQRWANIKAELTTMTAQHDEQYDLWLAAEQRATQAEAALATASIDLAEVRQDLHDAATEVAQRDRMLEVAIHIASGADDGCECADCIEDRRAMRVNVEEQARAEEQP